MLADMCGAISILICIALAILTYYSNYEYIELYIFIVVLSIAFILTLISIYLINNQAKITSKLAMMLYDFYIIFQIIPMIVGFYLCERLNRFRLLVYFFVSLAMILCLITCSILIYKKIIIQHNNIEIRMSRIKDLNVITTTITMLIIIAIVIINTLGKHIITGSICSVIFLLICIMENRKLKWAENFELIKYEDNFLIETGCIFSSLLIIFIFSESTLLNSSDYSVTYNLYSNAVGVLVLIPVFKNNRKIGKFGLNNY